MSPENSERGPRRGDVVVCALPGDYGKPRLAVVVQSDLFNPTHASVAACPLTSMIIDAPLFRIAVEPDEGNGLKAPSQVMVDKITALKSNRIESVIGFLTNAQLGSIDHALRRWLGFD